MPGVAVGVRVGRRGDRGRLRRDQRRGPAAGPRADAVPDRLGQQDVHRDGRSWRSSSAAGSTLDDPVGRHLPTFRLAAPGLADRVTVRHLLTHTARIRGRLVPRASARAGGGGRRAARAAVDAPGRRAAALPARRRLVVQQRRLRAGGARRRGADRAPVRGRPARPRPRAARALEGPSCRPTRRSRTGSRMPHASRERPPRLLRGAGWQPGWQLARADVPLGGLISSVQRPPRVGAVSPWAVRAVGAGAERRSRAAPSSACRRRSPRPAASPTRSASRGCSGRSADGASWATAVSRPATRRRSPSCRMPDAAVVVLTNATPGGTWLGREVTRAILRETIGVDDAPPATGSGLGR